MQLRWILVAAVFALGGCASTKLGYWSEYEVDGKRIRSTQGAESAHRDQVNAAALRDTAAGFDKPLKILRAPQPVMSPEDTNARVVGEVIVRIHFNTAGTVENIEVMQATKDSLRSAVIDAVSKWQIEPATKGGTPARVTAQQSFAFRTEW